MAAPGDDRPTRIFVGWAAGGATDVLARYMAKQLADSLDQPFIVENHPGAGGNIAAAMVAKSPPDGKTLIFLTSAHAINATLYKNLSFDPVKSFEPIGVAGFMPQLFVVNAKSPYATVQDVIAAAKRNPGGLTYASAGSGSSSHMAMEQFRSLAGIDIAHASYKGTSQYLPDLVANRVDMAIDSPTALLPLIRSGDLRALAVSSSERSAIFPDLPTLEESGVRGYNNTLWFGFLGPAGMPPDVLTGLNEAIKKVVSSPAAVEKLKEMGMTADPNYSPDSFRKMIQDDISSYAKTIQSSGARVE